MDGVNVVERYIYRGSERGKVRQNVGEGEGNGKTRGEWVREI